MTILLFRTSWHWHEGLSSLHIQLSSWYLHIKSQIFPTWNFLVLCSQHSLKISQAVVLGNYDFFSLCPVGILGVMLLHEISFKKKEMSVWVPPCPHDSVYLGPMIIKSAVFNKYFWEIIWALNWMQKSGYLPFYPLISIISVSSSNSNWKIASFIRFIILP